MQSWQIKIKVQVSESKYAQTLQYSNHILHHVNFFPESLYISSNLHIIFYLLT